MSKYYKLQRALSYNKVINIIKSIRGFGKTYGTKIFLIGRALEHGEQFLWLRRYEDEVDTNYQDFFKDVINTNAFPKVKNFSVVKNKHIIFYADKVEIGRMFCLSKHSYLKSMSYPNTRYIVLDEYLLEEGSVKYIPQEPNKLLSVAETVFRSFDYTNNKIFLLANNVSLFDPYLLEFNIQPNKKSSVTITDHVFYEEIKSGEDKEFLEEKEKTRWGSFLNTTSYGDIAMRNKPMYLENDFIGEVPPHGVWHFNIVVDGVYYGVWTTKETDGFFYINKKYQKNNVRRTFALDIGSHGEGTFLTKNFKNVWYLDELSKAFVGGYLMFDNETTKAIMYEKIGRMIMR